MALDADTSYVIGKNGAYLYYSGVELQRAFDSSRRHIEKVIANITCTRAQIAGRSARLGGILRSRKLDHSNGMRIYLPQCRWMSAKCWKRCLRLLGT